MLGSPVFRFQRNRTWDLLRSRRRPAPMVAAAAVDALLPESPSLQGYTVCEIDESLTDPLVEWLSKRPT